MDSESRRELVSYIVLTDAYKKVIKNMYVADRSKKNLIYPLPRMGNGGIKRRIAKSLLKKVADIKLREFLMNRLDEIESDRLMQLVKILTDNIDEILDDLSIPIDSKVTIDTTHLVRVPNSLNGKTGWKAFLIKDLTYFELSHYEVSIEGLDELFKIRIVVDLPAITIIDRAFKLRRGDIVKLEYAYASYLIFKGVAEFISIAR
jgi:DNA primase small subunit